jgi:hypothetical protein
MARRRSSALSLPQLANALAAHRTAAASLWARVEGVLGSITELESELAAAGGAVAARRGRPPGSKNKPKGRAAKPAKAWRRGRPTGAGRRAKGEDLNTFITKVLAGASKPMGIADITSAVKKAGYVSSSDALPKIVGMRLSGNRAFKRAGRGMYVLVK